MVAQVGGEEGVHARGAYDVEEAVAGAAADGDRADDGLGVAGDADALRGGGESLGGAGGQLPHGQRVVQLADPAQSPAAGLVRRVRYEGSYDPEVQGAGQRVAHPRVRRVRVGVGDVQRDVVLDEGVDDPALEVGRRDRRRTAQVERVVGDQQVGAQLHRLVDDLLDRVDGEQDPRDLLVGVAHDGADRVPGLGPLGRPEVLQRGDDVREAGRGDFRQTGHAQKATWLFCALVPVWLPLAPPSTPTSVSSGESFLGHPFV